MDVGLIRADERSAPFFAAAARDELLIKRCARCACWLGPEATGCVSCGDTAPLWAQASGGGTLVSWAGAGGPGGSDGPRGPGGAGPSGVLALVELDEGPWLHTRLDGGPVPPRAGLRVVAGFVHPAEGESYPVFWPEETADGCAADDPAVPSA